MSSTVSRTHILQSRIASVIQQINPYIKMNQVISFLFNESGSIWDQKSSQTGKEIVINTHSIIFIYSFVGQPLRNESDE